MRKNLFFTFAVALAIAVPAGAQPSQRRASLSGDASPNEAKCTIEVIVDGAAELEIRGDSGVLRNLSGRTPQWRRFECTARLPDSPSEFQVHGIDGRGSVQLVRDPRDGGTAMIRIEDPQRGSEAYTLNLSWRTRQGNYSGPGNSPPVTRDNSNQRRDTINQQQRMNSEFSPDQAIRLCEEGVRQQTATRLGLRDIQFGGTAFDDRPDRRDWIVGTFASIGRADAYRFSCAVDFAAARVQSVQIDPAGGDPYASRAGTVAVRTCQAAVQARIQRTGYNNVDFPSIDMDHRSGRNAWVVGNARGDRGNRTYRFNFSCQMNVDDGTVRSVNLSRK